jgi:hypothetical protein
LRTYLFLAANVLNILLERMLLQSLQDGVIGPCALYDHGMIWSQQVAGNPQYEHSVPSGIGGACHPFLFDIRQLPPDTISVLKQIVRDPVSEKQARRCAEGAEVFRADEHDYSAALRLTHIELVVHRFVAESH